MITIKSQQEIEWMRQAGEITARARAAAARLIAPGVTTQDIDRAVRRSIEKDGATPSFLGYGGFPASACVSINDEVIHGIPSARRQLREGDIVSVDVGAIYQGFHGDCAGTFAVGVISDEARKLIEVTRQSFYEGIQFAREGYRISDIGHAVQTYVEKHGFSVVRDFVGHGIGRNMHEAPEVPNFGKPGHGLRLKAGMVLAIEPMVNAGTCEVKILPDGWTVKTRDGGWSAHYENTVAITTGDPLILTVCDEELS